MLKKTTTMILILCVSNLAIFASGAGNEKEFAQKVKSGIAKLGTGTDARIEVKLKDGTKIKGYVSEAKEGSFVIINEKTGASSEIPYSNVKRLKGKNLSTGAKTAIGIAIGIGVVILILVLAARSD